MIPSKIAVLCFVGFVLLANFIEARPAPDGSDSKGGSPVQHVHHHHIGGSGGGGSGGGGSGGTHVHHHRSPGKSHTHHFQVGGGDGSGGTHVHHYSTGGSGGGGSGGSGGGANPPSDSNAGGSGGDASPPSDSGSGGPGGNGGIGGNLNLSGNLGNLGGNIDLKGGLDGLLKGFSPQTIAKFKKIIGNLDLSKLDLGNLNLGNLNLGGGGGGGGGGGLGLGGGLHKFDGKDSLQPSMCHDSINDRYGVGKHFVRGTRDVGFAIVSEAEAILDPIAGFLTHGIGQGLKALLCHIEDGFSDFGSDFDSATDIAKHGLVNFFKLQGPHPILGIPVGIGGIALEAAKAAKSIAGDAIGGVVSAVDQLVGNIG